MIKWISRHFIAKTLLTILILFFLFCFASTYSNYINFTEEAKQTSVNNISSMMKVLSHNFERTVMDIDYVTALISNKVPTDMNDSIIQYLTMDSTDQRTLIQNRRAVQEYLISMCSYKSYLQGMTIYGFNEQSVSFGISMTMSEIMDQTWYFEFMNNDFDIRFLPPHYSSNSRKLPKSSEVISIVRPILHNGEKIGLVVADIKSSMLNDMFNMNNINGYNIYIFNTESGEIIYSQNDNWASVINNANKKIDEKEGYYFYEDQGEEYLAVYETSEYTPWTIVGMVPEDNIISGFVLVRNKMLGLVILYALIFIMLVLISTNIVTKDLRRLTMAVASIDHNNLSLNIKVETKDEIGVLYQQIRAMVERIKELIQNIKISEKDKRNLEIKMLQTQINPHFLYNTLNTIKFLASMQGITNIQTVSNALSNILHLNLDTRKFISLKEEMEYLQNYLEIQEYRYAEKLTYRVTLDEKIKDYRIPKLLIQPIVENAIIHGIAPLEYKGVIQIQAYQEGEQIKILVKDNGGRFEQELISNNLYLGKGNSHIGLSNVCARLELLFGTNSKLSMLNEPGLYTIVEITLPLITEEGESYYE